MYIFLNRLPCKDIPSQCWEILLLKMLKVHLFVISFTKNKFIHLFYLSLSRKKLWDAFALSQKQPGQNGSFKYLTQTYIEIYVFATLAYSIEHKKAYMRQLEYVKQLHLSWNMFWMWGLQCRVWKQFSKIKLALEVIWSPGCIIQIHFTTCSDPSWKLKMIHPQGYVAFPVHCGSK